MNKPDEIDRILALRLRVAEDLMAKAEAATTTEDLCRYVDAYTRVSQAIREDIAARHGIPMDENGDVLEVDPAPRGPDARNPNAP